MNPVLPPTPASDWPHLVMSQVGAATLLLLLQAVGAAGIRFAELITASDVFFPAMAD